MVTSMTGFGQASSSDRDLSVDVVVRSVNGKHLKTKVNLGLNMPAIADQVTALVAKHMKRGTVEVSVRIDWTGAAEVALNERIIASYAKQLARLAGKLGLSAELHAEQLALLPGAMVAEGVSNRAAKQIWRKIEPAVEQAVRSALRMRASEGRALAADLRRCGLRIRALSDRVEKRTTEAADEYRQRLTARVSALLERAGVELDPAVLAREVILFCERSDISEELCRTRSHVDHLLGALAEDGAGRKLEFIAQEMQREANTMASKASDPQISEIVVDLRGEVDKIREQVANLE